MVGRDMIHIKHKTPLSPLPLGYNNATKANEAAPNMAKLNPSAPVSIFAPLEGITEDVAVGDIVPVIVELEFDDDVELDPLPLANVPFTTAGSNEDG